MFHGHLHKSIDKHSSQCCSSRSNSFRRENVLSHAMKHLILIVKAGWVWMDDRMETTFNFGFFFLLERVRCIQPNAETAQYIFNSPLFIYYILCAATISFFCVLPKLVINLTLISFMRMRFNRNWTCRVRSSRYFHSLFSSVRSRFHIFIWSIQIFCSIYPWN